VAVGLLGKVALTLAAFPAACVLLCAARVPPVHGWMMRHHCPIATWTMKQPSHPMETDGSAMVRAR
jgi:hypothetical protein